LFLERNYVRIYVACFKEEVICKKWPANVTTAEKKNPAVLPSVTPISKLNAPGNLISKRLKQLSGEFPRELRFVLVV
jgi:hypothetical protein